MRSVKPELCVMFACVVVFLVLINVTDTPVYELFVPAGVIVVPRVAFELDATDGGANGIAPLYAIMQALTERAISNVHV